MCHLKPKLWAEKEENAQLSCRVGDITQSCSSPSIYKMLMNQKFISNLRCLLFLVIRVRLSPPCSVLLVWKQVHSQERRQQVEVIQEMSHILLTVLTSIVYIVFVWGGVRGRASASTLCLCWSVLDCCRGFQCVGCEFWGYLICMCVCVTVSQPCISLCCFSLCVCFIVCLWCVYVRLLEMQREGDNLKWAEFLFYHEGCINNQNLIEIAIWPTAICELQGGEIFVTG